MGIIQRQGFKHAIVSYAGVAIGLVSVLFIYPRASELYGLFQLLYGSAMLCASFFMLGFNILAIKFFPVFQNEKNGHNGFLSFLMGGVFVGFLLFLVFLPFVRYVLLDVLFVDNKNRALFDNYFYYIIPLVFLFSFNFVFLKYISNFHRIVIPNILDQLFIKISLPTLTLLFIGGYFTISMFVKGIVANYILVFVGLIFYIKWLRQLHLKWNPQFITRSLAKEMRKYATFGLLNALGSQLAFRIDTLMVAGMVSISSGGIYAIVNVISDVITKPFKSIEAIASPIISKSWDTNDVAEIKTIYQKSSIILLVVGTYIFLGIWSSIDDLFSLMPNSKEVEGGKYVILFLGLARVFDLATSVNAHIIGYSKKFRFNFYALMTLGVLNIILNLVFIPKYQMVGAAMATFSSIILFNLMKLTFIWVQFKMQPFTLATLKILAIAMFCWGTIYVIPFGFSPFVNILLRSILLTIIFWGATWFSNVSPDVNDMIKKGVKRFF